MMPSAQKTHVPMVTRKNSHRHIWLVNLHILIKMWLIDRYLVFQFIKSVKKSNCERVIFFASFCLKYLVPTISVISATDLWSVIRIYKKGSIETLPRSFNTCQARQLLHGAVTWFCTKLEYNTTKSWFWGKLPSFNVIFERYRTRLIYTTFDIFWEWCKNVVDQKYYYLLSLPRVARIS